MFDDNETANEQKGDGALESVGQEAVKRQRPAIFWGDFDSDKEKTILAVSLAHEKESLEHNQRELAHKPRTWP
jgi:hypothetical protein